MTTEEMKALPKSDRVLRAEYLRTLASYQVGRDHVGQYKSDFYRRSLSGDEREAYMLGRFEAAADAARVRRAMDVAARDELLVDRMQESRSDSYDLEMQREREVS